MTSAVESMVVDDKVVDKAVDREKVSSAEKLTSMQISF